jgi:2-(1,2-epoxy-1,2-dihydrophenyl)acetyl-CoA isomerase
MELEGRYIAASAIEPDGRAGVDAFVNKRKPAFTGRV